MLLKKQSLHTNYIYIIRLFGFFFFKKKRFYDAWNFWLGEFITLAWGVHYFAVWVKPRAPWAAPRASQPVRTHPSGSVWLCLSTSKGGSWFMEPITAARSTRRSVLSEGGEERAQTMGNSWCTKLFFKQTRWAIQGPWNEVKLGDLYSGTQEGNSSLMDMEEHSQLQFHRARLS